jgi:glycine cleavage system H protein
MSTIKFTKDHEWVRIDGEEAVIGITDYAQQQLGDVVFVELPAVGAALTQGRDAAVVESVKAASEIFAPIDGEVVAVNPEIEQEPAKVNTDPLGAGWFFRLRPADPAQLDALMDEAAYRDFLAGLG